MFIGDGSKNVLVEMMHLCTPEENKKTILESFQSQNGIIRLLIATIALEWVLTAEVLIESYILDPPKM